MSEKRALLIIMMNQIAIMEALMYDSKRPHIELNLELHRKKTDEYILKCLSEINNPLSNQPDAAQKE